MYKLQAGYVQCPYESSHIILEARFQTHLCRCRKNYRDQEKVTCPFNVTHVLNKAELDWHVTVCPERASFENFKHRDASVIGASALKPESPIQNEYVDEENWDDLPDAPSYNPQTYASQAPILRNLIGQPRSVRKNFRAQERLRLMGIKNDCDE